MEGARTDPATGFGNRVDMHLAAVVAMARAQRAGHSCAVAVIKLPEAEDTWARDRSISLAMRASLRATDQIFRVDCDTLVALLPMTAGRGVGVVMERAARLTDRPFQWGAAFAGLDGGTTGALVEQATRRLRATP